MDKACDYIDALLVLESTDGEIVPPEFICPITYKTMRTPVVASDGFSYEYNDILKWMEISNSSPITREMLQRGVLIHNRSLQNIIITWATSHAEQCTTHGIRSVLTRI